MNGEKMEEKVDRYIEAEDEWGYKIVLRNMVMGAAWVSVIFAQRKKQINI